MTNYSDFDLDLQNTSVTNNKDISVASVYSWISCPTQDCYTIPVLDCLIDSMATCETVGGCHGASTYRSDCGCPPVDNGT